MVELIVDGIHLHPAMLDLTLRLKGKENIVLVTDSIRAKCLSDGCYELGGQSVTVKNNEARLQSGVLAGSVLTMNSAIANMMRFSRCTLADAIHMASYNPAGLLKMDNQKGSIAINKHADLVILDEMLNVVCTFREGQLVYRIDGLLN